MLVHSAKKCHVQNDGLVAKHMLANEVQWFIVFFAGLAQTACSIGAIAANRQDEIALVNSLGTHWDDATRSYRQKPQLASNGLMRSEDVTKASRRVALEVASNGNHNAAEMETTTSPLPWTTTRTAFAPCEANRKTHCDKIPHCTWVMRAYMQGCARDCASFTGQAMCTSYPECRWVSGVRAGCTDAEPICGKHSKAQTCQAVSTGTTHDELICTWSAWRGCILKGHLECADLDEEDCRPGIQDCVWSAKQTCIQMVHAQCGDYNRSACLFLESGRRGCWWQEEDKYCYKQ
eukprot:638877-Amphidinium_carterae.2